MQDIIERSARVVEGESSVDAFRASSGLAKDVLRAEGQYGRLSEIARELEVGRHRLYGVRERAEAVLAEEFDRSDETPEVEDSPVAGLPEEQVLFHLPVTVGRLKRASIALRTVAPASIRDIVALLPILYGSEAAWSYGKVQSVLIEAGGRAAQALREAELSSVECAVLDEMFSQRQPVLAGLDNTTQYLFLLEKRESRSGDEWHKVLAELQTTQKLNPKRVLKDAGTGLAKGVAATWPDTEQRDDCFHALYDFGRVRSYLERRAFGAISNEYECENRRARGRTEPERRRAGQEWRQAKERTNHAIDRFDTFERLALEAYELLRLTRPGTGELYTEEEVRSGLERVGRAMMEVGGHHARRAGRYLKNRAAGLALHLRSLGHELAQVLADAGGEAMTKAAARLYQAQLSRGSTPASHPKHEAADAELRAAIRNVCVQAEGSAAKVAQAMRAVFPVLDRRERASSAIENFNSVLRPYLVVHKNVEQNFLDLFRYYWNMRRREWGNHKGTSAYEQLTGRAVNDWLEALGYPCPATHSSPAH